VQLIEDAEHKEKYASKMSSLKHDLQVLLGKDSLQAQVAAHGRQSIAHGGLLCYQLSAITVSR
jgi:hypothetical protein